MASRLTDQATAPGAVRVDITACTAVTTPRTLSTTSNQIQSRRRRRCLPAAFGFDLAPL
jgi:hypothetical protein